MLFFDRVEAWNSRNLPLWLELSDLKKPHTSRLFLTWVKAMNKDNEARRFNKFLSVLKERARIKKHNKLFAGCLKTEAMLDYLHDRLTCEEAEVVRKHLGKCHSCAEELKLMRESEGVISD